MTRFSRRAWCVTAALVFVDRAVLAQDDNPGRVLIGRLMAPCCWTESLASHDSPTAQTLRDEIHQRALRGESLDAIERDVVARYGERVRAAPPGSAGLATATGIGVAALGVVLAVRARRWVGGRSGAASEAASEASTARADPGLDARIQAELDALDPA